MDNLTIKHSLFLLLAKRPCHHNPGFCMNRETTSKVHKGQQGANPKMRMLVYRERSYPARKVQGRDGSYTVAADSLVPELLDGLRSLDPAAFKLDEEIACYCSDEEIQKLADEELVEIIYEWQRL